MAGLYMPRVYNGRVMDSRHFQASRVGVLAPGTNGCGISKTSTLLYFSLLFSTLLYLITPLSSFHCLPPHGERFGWVYVPACRRADIRRSSLKSSPTLLSGLI